MSRRKSKKGHRWYDIQADEEDRLIPFDLSQYPFREDLMDDGTREIDAIEIPAEDTASDEVEASAEASADHDPLKQTPEPEDADQAMNAKCAELESRLLRVSADYQNFVRRSRQSTEDACQQQLMGLLKALLTPLDNFDHALAVEETKVSTEDLLQGVQIARDGLMKALEPFGLARMPVQVGDAFDPTRHEALARTPVEGMDADHIAALLQPGYMLGDKVLRPAKVAVSQ